MPVSNQYDQLPSNEVSTRVSMRFASPLVENLSLFALLVTRGSVCMHSGWSLTHVRTCADNNVSLNFVPSLAT